MQTKLFNRNFVMICLSNLAMGIAFFMLLPVMPLYLTEEVGVSKSLAGIIVALYTIGALIVRPLSGPVVDRMQRKPVLIITALMVALSCCGYVVAGSLLIFALVRLMHGFSFSFSSTSMSTIAVDNMPPEKMGTGIGFLGVIISLSMALAPMVGLALMKKFSPQATFIGAAAFSFLSLGLALMVNAPQRVIPPAQGPLFNRKNLVLYAGLLPALGYFLTIFSYGLVSNYIALLANEWGMEQSSGTFFLFLSAGLVLSRFFSGMLLDKGYLAHVIIAGKLIILAGFTYLLNTSGDFNFFISGLILGTGFGLCMPAYQGLIISLAAKEQIGTANSTFSLAMDTGIGVAVLCGGMIADATSLSFMYTAGSTLVVIALLLFCLKIRQLIKPAVPRGA